MPLNDDPDAVPDADYWDLVAALDEDGPCEAAIPSDEVAAALSRIDDADDYRNGGPPRG
jgi:hypothetical protein